VGVGNSSDKKPIYDHLLWRTDGSLAGAWWVKNQLEESKKSQAERDDLEGVRDICMEISEVLDTWVPDEECESENEFVFDLADYLEKKTDWEVEVQPDTPHGRPNILLGDKLALELKINPDKGERSRVVGQCAIYSRHWVTWIILIGASPSLISQLDNLLTDKGLDRILVWNFS
jgi:hypothetical protein